MSDWQVGDLALCVDDALRPDTAGPMRLKKGAIYHVIGMRSSPSGKLNLFVEGMVYPLGLGSAADRFRKIVPDMLEDCEPEFVTLLKCIKRTVRAQDDAHA